LSETSINFDTPAFNLPRILFGTGKIVLHYFTGGAANSTCSVVIKKLSVANTETDLATVSPFISASSKVAGTATASFTLSSTPLKKGEKIRITITASFYGNAGYIKIDPKNESWNYSYGDTSGTYTQADSNIEIPFKVDI
jgi:hypothetical protein